MNSTETKMAAPVIRETDIGERLTPEQFDKFSREIHRGIMFRMDFRFRGGYEKKEILKHCTLDDIFKVPSILYGHVHFYRPWEHPFPRRNSVAWCIYCIGVKHGWYKGCLHVYVTGMALSKTFACMLHQSLTRLKFVPTQDPVPIRPKPGKCPSGKTSKEETEAKEEEDHESLSSDNDDLVMSVDSIVESPSSEKNMCIDEPVNNGEDDEEAGVVPMADGTSHNSDLPNGDLVISSPDSVQSNTQHLLDTGQKTLPQIPEILQNLAKSGDNMKKVITDMPLIEMPAKSPYKGVMVPCGKLKDYLDSLLTFNRKCMLRKGREVHKIYVDMVKGECFLDDQFSYTEFGKMVLQNGSIRAGRAKNAKQIVVARETLYCSGTASCKRACGGYGVCLPGCDKTKMRGHRCAYRIKLTQRLGYVNFWFVEELGSHDQIGGGKDSEFKSNTQQGVSTPQHTDPYTSALDLSPKMNKISPERVIRHSTTTSMMNGGQCSVSTSRSEATTDTSPNYHYVLGLMPTASPSRESPSRSSPRSLECSANTSASQSFIPSAISLNKDNASPSGAINNTAIMNMNMATSQIVSTALPNLPLNVVNFMPELLGLGINSLPGGLNPLLVNVKQEPQEDGQGQGHVMIPMVMPGGSIQYSTSHIAKNHSPSNKEMSPSTIDSTGNTLKGAESMQYDNSQKMQCKQNTLGQVHNRIMERARSRKSAQTMRVPQKVSPDRDSEGMLFKSENEQDVSSAMNLSIPKSSQDISIGASEEMLLAGIPSMERFQTLNRILQSEAFQAAKSQLEQKKLLSDNRDQNQESALNLTVKQNGSGTYPINTGNTDIKMEKQSSYFRLMEEWKKENNKSGAGACFQNGHIDDSLDETDTEELTDNEKELINRVRQLETHVKQLQNVIIKRDTGQSASASRRKKAQRKFDFSKYSTRHVALKIMYLGCDYHGFAVQEDTDKTIEHVLFEALKKTQLIESRETSNYHRCGRTDKGVSAFGQVISIDLRSNLAKETEVKDSDGNSTQDKSEDKEEIRYCRILNKVLPPEIRVLAWAPVESDFSARFSCKQRTYKYMFPKANLDIPAMRQAAQKLIGERDYRNLCKMDVANGVTNFTRKILSADICLLDEEVSGYSMCELTIVGSSFLWHQIRCIVAVLFLIGQGNERVEIIDDLLDIEKNPKKPQYTMAHEVPLCLYDSEFGDNFEWIYEADWHEDNIKQLQTLWAEHTVKATMLKRMLEDLDKAKVETECDIAPWSDLSPPVYNQAEWLIPGNKPRVYKPLMDRPKCESLEERIEHLAKKRKLDPAASQDTEILVTEKE